MFKKNLLQILFLTLAVLGQYSLAKPTDNNVATPTTAENDNRQMVPSSELLQFTFNSLKEMTAIYVEKIQLLSEKVLKDQEIVDLDDNVEEVKDFKHKLSQIVEGFKSENKQQKLDIVSLYTTTTSAYFEQEDSRKLSENGKVIVKILKKYDTQKIEDEYVEEFNKFVTKFEEKYENLEAALKEEENNELKEKISQWHEEFKTLKTYDEKVEAIGKFTQLYVINTD